MGEAGKHHFWNGEEGIVGRMTS